MHTIVSLLFLSFLYVSVCKTTLYKLFFNKNAFMQQKSHIFQPLFSIKNTSQNDKMINYQTKSHHFSTIILNKYTSQKWSTTIRSTLSSHKHFVPLIFWRNVRKSDLRLSDGSVHGRKPIWNGHTSNSARNASVAHPRQRKRGRNQLRRHFR
jgi:hypothetical protein